MTLSNAGSILATLTQVDRMGLLADRVKNMPIGEFICILDFITAEFQQFLRAIDLINNEALETLLEQLLDAFTLKIGQIIQADRTTIFLINRSKNQLWYKTVQDETGETQEIRLPMAAGIIGHVANTGETVNVADIQTCSIFDAEVDQPPNYSVKNILCMPIFSSQNSEEIVAVVRLLNKSEGSFNQEDEQEFRSLADSIGIILESCQSCYIAARNQRGVAALLEATNTLGQSLDLQDTLLSVMEQARRLMHADRSTIFLYNKEKNELWTKVAKADGRTMVELRIPANRGIVGFVASTGQVLNITDAYTDPRFDPSVDQRTGYRTRNILCMPVYNSSGELIGVTQLINKHKGSFINSDEEFLRAFNAQAGIALQNAQLFENVMIEKQYQKDILQSLSDVVISTDMQGRIVTINDAALELLGCPRRKAENRDIREFWEYKLKGRLVWEIVPIENLKLWLESSLQHGSRHFVPEQTLTVGLVKRQENGWQNDDEILVLVVPEHHNSEVYLIWGERQNILSVDVDQMQPIERGINLTVNPLTNPEGGVRGGLVVLEDISREKRMKTTMYRYMTPGVAERVMALGEDGLMKGERKEVTILFSDIRGYTTITENLDASDVVALLNQYFETMVEAVFSHEGTLDKFIGDALMAVFGAPLPLRQNHAWMAVKSALDMRRRLKDFNRSRPDEPQIKIGIGMSSGEVVSGNIGSQKRMDYTVIGDGVNLSSRLEQLTKTYGCDIILSEMTYQLCSDKIWVRELDKVRVKGKNQAVNIYELIDARSSQLNSETEHFLEHYHRGREAYLGRDFKQAIQHFETAQDIRKTDHVVQIYMMRSREYLENKPPEDWDGIQTMTTK
ncbi:adenylate/guanylate cyclase domain-containing protein [Limnoraphis robusta Tam1]|uniref:GAF domain-containing protein n=1 Tax=Limnoraphis robusta TaxID=1118279 RepID=UPI002B20F301|nr:adenylate/guanylate cyclase domain-containing protein [Limnoraphis robusta]MEA5497312.1 adenylate/guanylate cyclase domain-containing protein [Limnoraphis robusta BA-68 BA1]MEA5538212.1 adenylate/guanylate cyclase domain-containing protein [Limnoraphis robusta Tam1]